jgi:peptide/nickel transport system permease protein
MTAYILRRLMIGVLIIVGVTILIFLMMRLLPGDPLVIYLNRGEIGTLTPEQIQALRHQFGLDQPLVTQYINWMGGIFHGDFGTSLIYHVSVGRLLVERVPVSFHIAFIAFIVGDILGISAGVLCAVRRGKWLDTVTTFLANIGVTMPGYWAGIILIYLLALKARWLPPWGYTSPFTDFWLNTRQLIMPVLCEALFPIAGLCRQTRSSMLEVLRQDYIRTAWSKGLSERVIIVRHAVKNALIPVVTMMGFQITALAGGSVLIETVFNIPGVGRLLTQSIQQQDYQVAQACTLMIAVVVVLANLITDISYGWLDPRIRYG